MDGDELLHLAGLLRRRTLARTQAADIVISTVWMSTGYHRLDGFEFETATIHGDAVVVVQRYLTEAGALTGHELWVAFKLMA